MRETVEGYLEDHLECLSLSALRILKDMVDLAIRDREREYIAAGAAPHEAPNLTVVKT